MLCEARASLALPTGATCNRAQISRAQAPTALGTLLRTVCCLRRLKRISKSTRSGARSVPTESLPDNGSSHEHDMQLWTHGRVCRSDC